VPFEPHAHHRRRAEQLIGDVAWAQAVPPYGPIPPPRVEVVHPRPARATSGSPAIGIGTAIGTAGCVAVTSSASCDIPSMCQVTGSIAGPTGPGFPRTGNKHHSHATLRPRNNVGMGDTADEFLVRNHPDRLAPERRCHCEQQSGGVPARARHSRLRQRARTGRVRSGLVVANGCRPDRFLPALRPYP
jgi:hypothetical protein